MRILKAFFLSLLVTGSAFAASPLLKSAIQLDPGNTKATGASFAYRLTYNCSSTSGPCLNAEVDDLLPAALAFISTVPASPTGDVAAINVTNNFGGSGRTRVQFVMVTPLTAGNSGDLLINVKFPNGSTPDGTVATNTADGINLGASPGTFTTPPVSVTATASEQVTVSKTLTTAPANLDMPESYRLRISNSGNTGTLNLTAVGPITDTLPAGTVFNGAAPAADCEPGCDGTTPATITWTSPCSLPVNAGANCDINLNVTFPSGTFTSGTNVTNSFTGTATALGQPPAALGVGSVTHSVTTFVPNPIASLSKNMAGGTPNPPTLNQTFSYDFVPSISSPGNVPLDNMTVIDTLPVQMLVSSVTTGAYNNLSDFAAGVGVRVSYEKSTSPGVFTLWGSSPNTTTNTTLTAPPPGLGAGEFLTRVKWEYGQAQVGMGPSTRPNVTGKIVNPDNAGAPVAFGNNIQNCTALSAVYTPGPTNVNVNGVCRNFTLSGPFVQLNPAKDNLSGGGPFNPGQAVSFRLHVRSASQSSDPAPLQNIVAADLLPVDLVFTSWTFDDQGTGLPAPQTFTQIPNYAGTGRVLLRWSWNAGSGSLGVNQQVFININTTVRTGAVFGSLTNTFDLSSNTPGLAQRCSGSSTTDALDLNGNASTSDTLCTANGSATIAPIAQLASAKTIKGTCDGGAVSTSAGTLVGGAIEYHLSVSNPGTVPMQNFVLIDILPFVGDTGVRDTSPRGSQWTPLLAAPITPPAGTTIYYTTTGNPCRGEVGGPTSGCTAPNWTTVAPDPITSVRAFKIDFGSKVLGPADVLNFTYSMVAPGNTPPGTNAFNSFAYQADRSDGLGSLAAEPQKVGISLGSCVAAGLGDFVWVDLNHNGIQDDGPTGLNNVYVQLFSPGPDGIQGTADDVPLSSTITSNSPTNQPGWYNFPGLAPGSYYVKVTPPPTFVFTLQHAGTSALDSDANPATGASPVVTLAANQFNPDIDFGLFTTHPAALGNYVWFDRNSNGIQDEAVTDGVNGVTVKLFVDNGDNTPGAGDVLVATTVTGDDVFGRPGYYLFDGLTPGLSYYVQFVLPAIATGFTSQHTGADGTVDSDANTSTGNSQLVTLAPDEFNPTIDAGILTSSGILALGDQVWLDTNNNGIFEPQNGETGIDGVRLDLYRDINNDGLPSLDEYLDTTTTGTVSGFAGRYRFSNLAPGNYIVVVHPSNFAGGGALFGLSTSTGNDPAPDPDDDVNGDDNGTNLGALIGSKPITLTNGGEPTSEDGDPNTNLTLDFGFITSSPSPLFYDYGDAPDTGSGTGRGNYNTTALDNGPFHLLGVPNAPYLGQCVDGDSGFLQNATATADDTGPHSLVVGTCAGTSDEDGVTFTGPFTPGTTAAFTVTAGGGPTQCHLDAWVDWNQDGIFGNSPGEQIATNLIVPLGPPTVLSPLVPADAIPGTTYARFRCSSAGNLPPTGPAADGEVEDYAVGIIGFDYGDAPASYGTSGAGAARHRIVPGTNLTLGQCVDTELDGQPSVGANGDDGSAGTSRIGTCADDEDGVVFTSPIATCTTASVTVTAGAAGKLDAWIDFNRNGTFNDAGEQIFVSQPLNAGPNNLTFNVPCTASGGLSYMRFRLSSAGGLGPTGDAPDGEVEDYAVTIKTVDFGDAPNTYGTTFASNGARHVVVPGFSLGATIDSEPDGQPNATATGDGADEDGVSFTGGSLFHACNTQSLTVTLTNTAGITTPKLDAWIDFDGDGVFDNPRDHVVIAAPLVAGANVINVNVPCDAKTRTTYARFRLSSTGTATPTGQAIDGEVEDYLVTTAGLDFGDAPDPAYPTTLASNGARHYVIPANNPTLGPTVTTEPEGQPNATATGDSGDDGVTFPAPLIPGTTGSITLTAGPTGGTVTCWMDFNHNGSWGDATDHIVTDTLLPGGTSHTFNFPIPVPAVSGPTMTRCRISSLGGLAPTGVAPDGEVEDWAATMLVAHPQIGVGECLVSTQINDSVATDIGLDVRVTNTGNVPLTSVTLHTPLATLLAPATYTILSLTATGLAVNPGYNGNSNDNLLAAGTTLTAAQSGVVHLVIRVNPQGVTATYQSSSTATGVAPDTSVVSDISQDGCNVDPDNDGNPGNNSTPTPFLVAVLVPALSMWVLMFLGAVLAAIAVRRV
ncbi:MAG TPA: GEVED domain-containing protein [Thermoanaerobaculia bacterium]|nr:GEVED domain-containing protein [Thermoanaerobaculia bacterium]